MSSLIQNVVAQEVQAPKYRWSTLFSIVQEPDAVWQRLQKFIQTKNAHEASASIISALQFISSKPRSNHHGETQEEDGNWMSFGQSTIATAKPFNID